MSEIVLTGLELTPAAVAAAARDGATVTIDPRARERMERSNALVRAAAASPAPVYGVTTGLGARVGLAVRDASGEEFSLRTIRGRATAVGEPLSRELTRAAMVVRLNGLCAGGAGASVAVADHFAAALNRGLHPSIPGSGSLGAADLCLMAHVGLGLIGEGECELDGERLPGALALSRAGLSVPALGPKDGLAICSSSAVSIGAATLALVDGLACLEELQVAAALSMEGFRASLTPLDPRVVQARPAPGQGWAAAGLRALLGGGALAQTPAGSSRRLQDPLSFRCASQIHGSLYAALGLLRDALAPDLNGAADNPLVLAADGEIVSNGNFQGPALALALDAVAIAVAQVAHASAQRQARLVTPRLSGLEPNLVEQDPDSPTRSGAAPLGKAALALVLEIRHRAAPLAIHSMVEADGVEDDTTGAAQGALRLLDQFVRLQQLIAIELLVGAQATDLVLRGDGPEPPTLGVGTGAAHRAVREVMPPLGEDRPLGPEAMRLRDVLLLQGRLRERVRAATDGTPAS